MLRHRLIATVDSRYLAAVDVYDHVPVLAQSRIVSGDNYSFALPS